MLVEIRRWRNKKGVWTAKLGGKNEVWSS